MKKLFLIAVVLLLYGCIHSINSKYHSFQFDALADSPNVEILDFRYGTVAYTRAWKLDAKKGNVVQGKAVAGDMPIGEDMFVKWRDKSTGQVFEETANLQQLKHMIDEESIV